MLLVVADQLSGLTTHFFKDVVDEGIHDTHAALGDAGFRMDLLEHPVDIN